MQIKAGEPKFTPLTITLETRDEVYDFLVIANSYLTPTNERGATRRYNMAKELDSATRAHHNETRF